MIALVPAEARLFWSAWSNRLLVGLLVLLAAAGALNGAARLAAADAAAAGQARADHDAWAAKIATIAAFEAGRQSAAAAGGARMANRAILGAASQRWTAPSRAAFGALSASDSRPTPDGLPVGVASRYRAEDPSLDDPTNRVDGAFDLAFVASWLAPLAALLLGFDVLSRDRELRIAPLLAAQGASLGRIAAARLVVRFAALFAAVALPALAAAFWSEGASAAVLPAWLVWAAGYALLLIFWLSVAGIVNATARSTVGATMALLLSWITLTLLTPALLSVALARIAPAPDRMAGVLQLRALETELTKARAKVTADFYAANPQRRPVAEGDEYVRYFIGEYYPRQLAFIDRYAPIAAAMDRMRVRQAGTLRWGAVFSPGLAFKLLSEDLAGGAPERRVAYLAATDAFQHRWLAHFDVKLASMRPLTLADYRSAPVWHAVAEPAAQRWPRLLLILSVLLAPAAGAAGIAALRLRRAEPL